MIKGRELDCCSRGPTLLVFRSRMRCRIFGDAQLYDIVVKVERPLLAVLLLRGNHPPILLASASMCLVGLSSDSRSRMCSEEAHPLRTFTMHRIAVGCRLVLFSLNACQSIYNCDTKDSIVLMDCQTAGMLLLQLCLAAHHWIRERSQRINCDMNHISLLQ
jgi:hypothetical protein